MRERGFRCASTGLKTAISATANRLGFGSEFVILLAGGDKSTQASDIKTALKLARHLEA